MYLSHHCLVINFEGDPTVKPTSVTNPIKTFNSSSAEDIFPRVLHNLISFVTDKNNATFKACIATRCN